MAPQQTTQVVNGIDTEALQSTIHAIEQNPELGTCKFRAHTRWLGANHSRTTIDDFYAAQEERHHLQSFEVETDEPPILAGQDLAPNPVEHLLSSLSFCLTTAIVAHAAVRGINIEELEAEVEGDIDLQGYLGLSNKVPRGYTNIRVNFRVKTDEANMDRLKRLAEYSPVYNTLLQGVNVDLQVEPK
jgi:uncharacterized OsmC-like protein